MKNHGPYTSPQVYARIAGVLLITSFMAGGFWLVVKGVNITKWKEKAHV